MLRRGRGQVCAYGLALGRSNQVSLPERLSMMVGEGGLSSHARIRAGEAAWLSRRERPRL